MLGTKLVYRPPEPYLPHDHKPIAPTRMYIKQSLSVSNNNNKREEVIVEDKQQIFSFHITKTVILLTSKSMYFTSYIKLASDSNKHIYWYFSHEQTVMPHTSFEDHACLINWVAAAFVRES